MLKFFYIDLSNSLFPALTTVLDVVIYPVVFSIITLVMFSVIYMIWKIYRHKNPNPGVISKSVFTLISTVILLFGLANVGGRIGIWDLKDRPNFESASANDTNTAPPQEPDSKVENGCWESAMMSIFADFHSDGLLIKSIKRVDPWDTWDLKEGDIIVSMGGTIMKDPLIHVTIVQLACQKRASITVKRNGQQIILKPTK